MAKTDPTKPDTPNTVQAHIKNLRSKLPVDIIKTVRGLGYRLEGAK